MNTVECIIIGFTWWILMVQLHTCEKMKYSVRQLIDLLFDEIYFYTIAFYGLIFIFTANQKWKIVSNNVLLKSLWKPWFEMKASVTDGRQMKSFIKIISMYSKSKIKENSTRKFQNSRAINSNKQKNFQLLNFTQPSNKYILIISLALR